MENTAASSGVQTTFMRMGKLGKLMNNPLHRVCESW